LNWEEYVKTIRSQLHCTACLSQCGERLPDSVVELLILHSSKKEGNGETMDEHKYRVVIAEDYAILRKGLKALLMTYPRMDVVGEAQDGHEAIQQVENLKPDLLLLDLSMPRLHGLDALREIKKKSVKTKVLVLTVHKEEDYILAAFKAGADGYIL
jgi:CheY-like chemotaxis protein